ncbi:MAG: ABC transporter permease subunit [Chloroflexi bacterium]|nr:ABC transporter permease subunit [Chloroflexota bacterium]
MAVANAKVGVPSGTPSSLPENSTLSTVLKYLGLALFNAFTLLLVYAFFRDENLGLALVFVVIGVGLNVIFFVPALYPLRWMSPGLALITLLVIYPIIYTVLTSFTNFGDGHRLPKSQAITQIERIGGNIVPEDAARYSVVPYLNAEDNIALWLTNADETLFVPAGGAIQVVADPPAEPPAEYDGYSLVPRNQLLQVLRRAQNESFGDEDDVITVSGREAIRATLVQRFVYDEVQDAIVDQTDGTLYRADEENGFFVGPNGRPLQNQPGYRVNVGLFNFERMIADPGLRGPLIDIFVWTVVFAFLSVLLSFVVGLAMALVMNDPRMPARTLIRSLLIIPYAIPGVISIVVWRGMLNLNLGVVTNVWNDLFGVRPGFLIDPWLAKFSILLVNTWLGYPYMMLICSGALQAIPSEVYEAAAVDGAKPWQRFWGITLPLLLVSVGPLLIASFTFNFNNYLLIEALTGTDAPNIPNSPVPARYTDILISYTYNIAFGNRGSDYGYASAITIVIFVVVAAVTLMQYRYTKTWEQVGENV